jgi:hypothetical protein
VSYLVNANSDSMEALTANYDPGCGCAYWTSAPRPAHSDRCIPVRAERVPAGLLAHQLRIAATAPSALDSWVQDRPVRRRSAIDMWVADTPDRREQLYQDLATSVRRHGVGELPDGFVDLAISVGLARLADAEDRCVGRPDLAERVDTAIEDLPRLVAAAVRDATAVTAGGDADNGRELVAQVTAELGPRLMEEIHRAVNVAVDHSLKPNR